MTFQEWWHNSNYDREHMRRFYEARPEWADLPPEVVATSMAFQFFAVGEGCREVGKAVREAFFGNAQ